MIHKKMFGMLSAAVTAGFCVSAFAAETPIADLVLDTQTWFSVKETGSTGGTWAPAIEWVGETGSKVVEFDTDLDDQLIYTAPVQTDSIQSIKFTLECSPVLEANLPAVADILDAKVDAKAAFAVRKDSEGALAFVALINGAWTALSGVTPPAAGTQYDLFVTLDDRGTTSTCYIKYEVQLSGGTKTALTYGSADTFARAGAGSIGTLAFVGTGSFKEIDATKSAITAEKLTVGGQTIKVSEEDMAAFKKGTLGADAATVKGILAEEDDNGLTVGENYILGLCVNQNGTMTLIDDGKILMKGDASAASDTEIKVKLNAIAPDTGVSVKYQICGSNDKSVWTAVGTTQTDASALSIPLGGTKYNFYKVTTIVGE